MERSYQDYIEILNENLPRVREGIVSHAKAGQNVTLLAATKTVPVEVINYAITELGITHIGENRVQELLEKYPLLHKDGVSVHFIGRLQTNKVKYIIDKVSLIHSVDSLRLAREIDRQAAKHSLVMDILIEVNIGGEDSKGGILPGELDSFLEEIASFSHVRPMGLMVIPPQNATKEETFDYFTQTYQFFVDFCEKKVHNNTDTYILSMGMSDSYEDAVSAGANLVRIGSAIFGRRRAYPLSLSKEGEGKNGIF